MRAFANLVEVAFHGCPCAHGGACEDRARRRQNTFGRRCSPAADPCASGLRFGQGRPAVDLRACRDHCPRIGLAVGPARGCLPARSTVVVGSCKVLGFGCSAFKFSNRLFGKRSASGRRRTPGSGGQATDPAGAVHRLRPVGGWLVHGGRDHPQWFPWLLGEPISFS